MNTLKTWILMGILTVILVLIGRFIGGAAGMLFFLVLSIAMNAIAYWTSGSMAIAMTRSYPVSERELPEVYAIVRRLTQRAGLPMPEIYVTPSPQPNAFATGRDPKHAKVAVTEGILRVLPSRELEGVLAHEIGHVRNRDILISSMAAMLAGVITYIANILQWGMWFGMGDRDDRDGGNALAEIAMIILAPLAATVIQLAISRSREYQADATGARLVGDGNPLADALEHLEAYARQVPSGFNPATSHLFIVNPLRGQSIVQLFSTHPPTEERVRRLRAMRISH
ncbi:zinc metalloprotease HtpX [Alicyclobacillus cycloheptanicus]|uniref:Protease HtpX homolog n=1 Tax=Alicyclobacillus cycloheptanicus TaxID=1457 RepID=A0ABT9XG14_9BACL|nr:zinc metalloprotease HtpX [Alicyclobacillus cycloheptanicus]MDQ0189238.1 heat shock protein HtpX [Alicyclobacillus cycloheptanicus]WDM00422.1 zinc metalloprotease HtpX [Alicyclobacillus cycloheptanicus]